jgi:hypothetical protein
MAFLVDLFWGVMFFASVVVLLGLLLSFVMQFVLQFACKNANQPAL